MSNIVLAAGGDDGYQISRSVRLRSSLPAYFNRTPASAGNRNTWTWSAWFKIGTVPAATSTIIIFDTKSSVAGVPRGGVSLVNGALMVQFNSTGAAWDSVLTSAQVIRDPSAWYHLTVVVNTPQATAANRVKMYLNGAQVTSFSTATYPVQNYSTPINLAQEHRLGANGVATAAEAFDGYLTEVNFIDGQALTPSSFGETDVLTGVWKPKKYAGTYGTNGFYLNFSDPSAATAAAIGKDSSGNGNNWTPNNISVTAGATYDSMIDTPTLFGEQGNFNVWNPLSKGANVGLTNGNLDALGTVNTNTGNCVFGTIAVSTGKWYAEFRVTNTYSYSYLGVVDPDNPGSYPGANSAGYGMEVGSGLTYNVAAGPTITGAVAGDTIMVALDMTAGKIWWGKNGTWGGSGNPGAGTGQQFSGLTGQKTFALSAYSSSGAFNSNFGQRPFAYTPPTGFKALNTQNLPDATIKKGNQYFDATLYTGNGTSQTITNSGGFQPDFFWNKERGGINQHNLVDSVRGTGVRLRTDGTDAEGSIAGFLSFASNGFSLTTSNVSLNGNGQSYVAWQWKESASAGFDIVTYTGNGSNGQTVNHSLGVKPAMLIIKGRDVLTGNGQWIVQHQSLSGGVNATSSLFTLTSYTSVLLLQATSAAGGYTYDYQVGQNTKNYVAYLFAEVAGFSKFGSYTGNGSADGPFVYCGFRPRFILVKSSTSVQDWKLIDTARNAYNSSNSLLGANISAAEDTNAAYDFDILSNGFKPRNTFGYANTSGQTYIYAAFAENPFKNSLAR